MTGPPLSGSNNMTPSSGISSLALPVKARRGRRRSSPALAAAKLAARVLSIGILVALHSDMQMKTARIAGTSW
jgi:hypothetical protein